MISKSKTPKNELNEIFFQIQPKKMKTLMQTYLNFVTILFLSKIFIV